MSDASFQLVRHSELTSARRQLLAQWGSRLFGRYEGEPQEWADPDWHVLLLEGGKLVSQLNLTLRTILVGAATVRVAGVGAVMTPKEFQGSGFARKTLRKGQEFFVRELGVEFGLLTCFQHLVPLYEGLGWQLTDAPYWFHQSSGRQRWLYSAMWYPCRETVWPAGDIDVCGKPW